jgi:hypothetical protein
MTAFMEHVAKGLDGPARITAAAVGVLYGLGFTVINLMLASFGVSDFSSFDVKFVLTGILFVGFVVLPFAPFLLAIWLARVLRQRLRAAARVALIFVIVAAALSAAGAFIEYVIDAGSYGQEPPPWLYQFAGWRLYAMDNQGRVSMRAILLLAATACAIVPFVGARSAALRERPGVAAIAATIVGLTFWMLLTDFAFEKVRHLRAGYGGAAYGRRSFVLAKPQRAALQTLHVPMNEAGVLEGAAVLYENHDNLILLAPWSCGKACWPEDGNYFSFQIAKESVEAVRWAAR